MGSPDKSGEKGFQEEGTFSRKRLRGRIPKKAVSLLYAELDTAFIQIFQDDYHSNCEFIFSERKRIFA